ncbi:MAG: AmmeMemoRadiSam system protein A [Desulfuromonadales bacterium]|nr:AmmeMemoRadiSam system protein A [Desulfuromonadales bacterium]
MKHDNQLKLLKLARQAIDNCLRQTDFIAQGEDDPQLTQQAGCFVTIKINGQLRGCLGNFVSSQPLYLEVTRMAVAAATEDPRFRPMTAADLGKYTLDISVLSPLQKISDPNLIEVGKHGIYLEHNGRRGVLLPQVATEQGWDRQTFLEQTCRKAGLPDDAWQSADARLYVFTAEIIEEK